MATFSPRACCATSIDERHRLDCGKAFQAAHTDMRVPSAAQAKGADIVVYTVLGDDERGVHVATNLEVNGQAILVPRHAKLTMTASAEHATEVTLTIMARSVQVRPEPAPQTGPSPDATVTRGHAET